MQLKEHFENLELKDIHGFVSEQTAEDLFLEFKNANFPQAKEFDKKNFSKCLSGFSNSVGGILVWGVLAKEEKGKPDVANRLKPIYKLLDFENYLKKNEGNAIVPLTEGVEYRRIFESGESGYLLVYIPSSERAPHMALFADKRYYKRSGDSFYMCEHFDIVDMFSRRTSPKLDVVIQNESITKKIQAERERFKYQGIFSVRNTGQVSLKYLVVFLKVLSPFRIADYGIDGNGNRGMKTVPTKDNFIQYVGGNDLVIHPETHHEVDKIVLNEIGLKDSEDDLFIEYKVIAEGMKLLTGTLTIEWGDLKKRASA